MLTFLIAVLFFWLFLFINMGTINWVGLVYAQLISIYVLIVYSVAAFPIQFVLQMKNKSKKFNLKHLGLYIVAIIVVSIVIVLMFSADALIQLLVFPLFYGICIFVSLFYWLLDSIFLLLKERLAGSC
ncbi:UPF0715 family protein [Bacillus changyiensis]|uniref:UPF0715 family protein n=1 Tax=Bacillus changyiensis TaxID=3004103 RepID=UPI0022DFB5DF|nr:UPF0715 family protein [Bacillus changyiensis]MDA1475267.1 UPF0715 family protein [Bacillus changyiensis]